jgi:hypothetical protein
MNKWAVNRKKPYTEIGIRRLSCIRCDDKAAFQWSICADGNNYRPLCVTCDAALNAMVLEWMKHPKSDVLARAYELAHNLNYPTPADG